MLTHFLSCHSRAYGILDASVYILSINIPLKESQRRFKDFERKKFTVSFIIHPFQEWDIMRAQNLFFLCSKKKVSELEIEVTNLQREISMKT